jgi:hypothetical protein
LIDFFGEKIDFPRVLFGVGDTSNDKFCCDLSCPLATVLYGKKFPALSLNVEKANNYDHCTEM